MDVQVPSLLSHTLPLFPTIYSYPPPSHIPTLPPCIHYPWGEGETTKTMNHLSCMDIVQLLYIQCHVLHELSKKLISLSYY